MSGVPDADAVRVIPDPGFAGDDGSAARSWPRPWPPGTRDPTTYAEALAALQRSRLLVPVVAVLGEVEYDDAGLARDKSSDMATVLMQGADGRLALLAFTGTEALHRLGPAGAPGAGLGAGGGPLRAPGRCRGAAGRPRRAGAVRRRGRRPARPRRGLDAGPGPGGRCLDSARPGIFG